MRVRKTGFDKELLIDCGCFEFTACCPAEPGLSWDSEGSIETLARNNSGPVAVLGGRSPYSWTVSGTGFSIISPTVGKSTTLTADGTACGSATITDTDACGETVTGYVREPTFGNWINKTSGSCVFGGAYDGIVGVFYYKIVDNKRQRQEAVSAGGGGCVSEATCAGQCETYSDGQGPHPTCLTGAPKLEEWCECLQSVCDPGEKAAQFWNPIRNLRYDEWEC